MLKNFSFNYNSPIVLTFALISLAVLVLSGIFGFAISGYFMSPTEIHGIGDIFRLVSHIFGHANWGHYFGNFSLILLIGSVLEKQLGSLRLLAIMGFTALVSGILCCMFLDVHVLGASGIVFMMILLMAVYSHPHEYQVSGKINVPITVLLVALIYLGSEIAALRVEDNISHFGHIIGGFCGAIFGYLLKK